MRKTRKPQINSDDVEEAILEARRNEFLQGIFDLHKKQFPHLSEQDEADIFREFEDLDPEND